MIAKCHSCPAFCTCILPSYIHRGSNSQFTLRKLSPYYGQVQGQMAVTGRAWCDFFLYTCNGNFSQRIVFDEEFVSSMFVSLGHFFQTYVIPELFTRTLQRELDTHVSDNMEVDQAISIASSASCVYVVLGVRML